MGFEKQPIYVFKDCNSTGLDTIPMNSLVLNSCTSELYQYINSLGIDSTISLCTGVYNNNLKLYVAVGFSKALFYGGDNLIGAINICTLLSSTATLIQNESNIGTARYELAGANVGTNALFYGGYSSYSNICTLLSSTATGLSYNSGSGIFSLTSGYVIPTTAEQTNWNIAYTNRITSLTTTGNSGAATLISNVLNIPTYTLTGLGGVPDTRTVAGFPLSSNVTLADLTATNTTLTFSGTYNGSTARTIGLNLGNANTWTVAQTFNNGISVASNTGINPQTFTTLGTNDALISKNLHTEFGIWYRSPSTARTNGLDISSINSNFMGLYVGGAERATLSTTGIFYITRIFGNTTTDAGYTAFDFNGTGRISGNTTITSGQLLLNGNRSASSWGVAGVNFQTAAATYTDTSTAASGTVAVNAVNSFGIPTLTATNANVTNTIAANVYIAGAPSAGTNITNTTPLALFVASGISRFDGTVLTNSSVTFAGSFTTNGAFAANLAISSGTQSANTTVAKGFRATHTNSNTNVGSFVSSTTAGKAGFQ